MPGSYPGREGSSPSGLTEQGCGVTAARPPPNRPGVGSNPTAPAGWLRCTCSRAASTSACQAGEVGSIPARCFERGTRNADRRTVPHSEIRIPSLGRRPRQLRRTPHAPVVYWPARHSVTVEGRVQFSSGALGSRHGTPTGRATKLKPWRVWVRFPPVLLFASEGAGTPGGL